MFLILKTFLFIGLRSKIKIYIYIIHEIMYMTVVLTEHQTLSHTQSLRAKLPKMMPSEGTEVFIV